MYRFCYRRAARQHLPNACNKNRPSARRYLSDLSHIELAVAGTDERGRPGTRASGAQSRMSLDGTKRQLLRSGGMSGVGRRPEVTVTQPKWPDWPGTDVGQFAANRVGEL